MKITYKFPKNFLDQLFEDRLQSGLFKAYIRRQMAAYFSMMLLVSLLLVIADSPRYMILILVFVAVLALPFFPRFQRRISKRYWVKMYKGHRLPEGERTLTFNKKGLRYQGEDFDLKYDWTQVHSLNQEGHFYSIVLHGLTQIHVPKKALKGKKAKAEFESFFESN